MTTTWPERLTTERRLLAALFLWPTRVELEAQHFLAPAHGALFTAIQAAGDVLLDENRTLPALREFIAWDDRDDLFSSVGGLDDYVIEQLVPMPVTPHAIPDLVELVRQCPRCGR